MCLKCIIIHCVFINPGVGLELEIVSYLCTVSVHVYVSVDLLKNTGCDFLRS